MKIPQFGFVWSVGTVTSVCGGKGTRDQTSARGGIQKGGGSWSRGARGTAGTALFGAGRDTSTAAASPSTNTALACQGQGSWRSALGVGGWRARGCRGGGGGGAERDTAAPRQSL